MSSRLAAQAEVERRKLYRLNYLGTQLLTQKGDAPDTIRLATLGGSGEGEDNRRLATVREAVEDALAGRPCRYWRQEDFKVENCLPDEPDLNDDDDESESD